MIVVAVIAALVTGAAGAWAYAPTVGWCFASLLYSVTVWLRIRRLDAAQTKARASREDPSRGLADLLIILLSIASLFAVVFVLVHAAHSTGVMKGLLAGLALLSVALSWVLLHTLYTLRYAKEFYTHGPDGGSGGVDFNQKTDPQYTDFAYLAFTLGMTYQVSDTSITSHAIRSTALRHSLLSFVFGAVILASTINLVVQLST
ncbi:hypothetical protein BH09ACT1_BH09ACT1_18600 [soil metagenome]